MLITNLISRYMKLCKAAFSAEDGAKLSKSIQTNVMEMLFLLMVIPRRCNFKQMGRYGNRGEQCYRQTAERSVNWLEMNMWLSAFALKEGKGRNAIVIDPSFIKKAGKHTPYVGTFWSGCAGAVKHGLEILGIGVIDVDLHDAEGCADHIGKRRGEKRDEPVRLVCQGVGGRQGKAAAYLQGACRRLSLLQETFHRQGNEDGIPCCEPPAS